jgi:hypothetical protein
LSSKEREVIVLTSPEKATPKEGTMARYEPMLIPDRFALEAAAHQNRSEGYARAFDALAHWLQAQFRLLFTHEGRPVALTRAAKPRRLAH